jgi:cobalt-zinc-cadmium resistance protein CzcA
MTTLVEAPGPLPVALAIGIGADSQRPFVLPIVGDTGVRLPIDIFLPTPALHSLAAGTGDRPGV